MLDSGGIEVGRLIVHLGERGLILVACAVHRHDRSVGRQASCAYTCPSSSESPAASTAGPWWPWSAVQQQVGDVRTAVGVERVRNRSRQRTESAVRLCPGPPKNERVGKSEKSARARSCADAGFDVMTADPARHTAGHLKIPIQVVQRLVGGAARVCAGAGCESPAGRRWPRGREQQYYRSRVGRPGYRSAPGCSHRTGSGCSWPASPRACVGGESGHRHEWLAESSRSPGIAIPAPMPTGIAPANRSPVVEVEVLR